MGGLIIFFERYACVILIKKKETKCGVKTHATEL